MSFWARVVIKLWVKVTTFNHAREAKRSKSTKRKNQEKTSELRHYCLFFVSHKVLDQDFYKTLAENFKT